MRQMLLAAPFRATMMLGSFVVMACQDVATPSLATAPNAEPNAANVYAGAVFGYVASSLTSTVWAFYSPGNRVVATIQLGAFPNDVAVTPDGAYAYVPLQHGNSVAVVHTATNQVVRTIPVPDSPHYIAFRPHGALAYVTSDNGLVMVISTATQAVVATIGGFVFPRGVAFSPDGAYAFVANGDGRLSKINTATHVVISSVTLATAAFDVELSPDGGTAYVTAGILSPTWAYEVTEVNTATMTPTAHVPLAAEPRGLGIVPGGAQLYVLNTFDKQVTVISTASNTVVATIPVSAGPSDVAFTPDGSLAYVSHFGAGDASVISTATNAVVGSVANAGQAIGIAMAQLANPPRAHRPPPSGRYLGIAEKALVEVCNAYGGGFGPSATVRVTAEVPQGTSWRIVDKYAITLKEGGCKDVWLNPLDAATRVTVIQESIPGFTTACTTSRVGPGSGKVTLPCAAPNTSIVFNSLDIGYLVEFRNF